MKKQITLDLDITTDNMENGDIASIQKTLNVAFEAFLQSWSSPLKDIADGIDRLYERQENTAQKIAPYLTMANLWISPSAPFIILEAVSLAADKKKLSVEDVENIFIHYYSADNWRALIDMVMSWNKNSFFAERSEIIQDALDAHIREKYTLSIPALLPQIEGVLSSAYNQPAGHPSKAFKDAIEKEYYDFFTSVSKEILVEMATSPFLYGGVKGEYFLPEKFKEWLVKKNLDENRILNRAAILHGVQINYANKANSLRVFLLLDVIAWVTQGDKMEMEGE